MRRLLTVLACATLVAGLGAPAWGNSSSGSGDQPISAMGKGHGRHGGHHRDHGGRGYHRGGRGHHDGYHHGGYRRGYRHGYRDRYYDGGYYGCGYYPDCDPYYGGGYYGGRRYYNDRYYYDRYDYDRGSYGCGRGQRYDSRCDCYHRDTRCDRNYSRERQCGSGDCYYRSRSADPEPASAPAADSPSPQQH